MTVLDWLKGITRYNFEDTTFQTIALGRSVGIDDDISNLNAENKELLTADIIFTAVVLSPSSTSSSSISHGGFQMSKGSETDQNQSLKIKYAKSHGSKVIAVGTTSVRTLESAAKFGTLTAQSGNTELFIQPGFKFKVIDGMITNFHLPRSTLLALVGAFAGMERIFKAYHHAIEEHYRFFSYGDAMLIL